MLQSIFLIEHPGQVSSTQVYIHFAEFIQISLFSSPDKRIFNVNNEHPSVIVVDLASPLIGITLGKYFFERVFPQPGSCSSADVNGFRKMAEDRRQRGGGGLENVVGSHFLASAPTQPRGRTRRGEFRGPDKWVWKRFAGFFGGEIRGGGEGSGKKTAGPG